MRDGNNLTIPPHYFPPPTPGLVCAAKRGGVLGKNNGDKKYIKYVWFYNIEINIAYVNTDNYMVHLERWISISSVGTLK